MNFEKKRNLKDTDVFKFIQKNITAILIGLIFIQVGLITCQLFLGASSLILSVILSVIPIGMYLIFKNVNEEVINMWYFKLFIVNFATLIINDSFIELVTKIFGADTGAYKILFMVDFGIIILAIALFQQEIVQSCFTTLESRDFLENTDETEEPVFEPGDAFIGYKEEDGKVNKNKPVILPVKDRYLHMLILGPTGCGKTSQTLIPMINRDMTNRDAGIIVLEPKGDLAEKVYAMANHYEREVVYFNPILPDCPYFNPLYGKESDVVENMATTFNMLNPDSPQFFKDMSDNLIRKCIKLLKRIYGDDATLIDLNTLVWDTNGEGRKMVMQFSKIKASNPDIQKENEEIYSWVLNDYYSGMSGARGSTKTFEHCSGIRSQISKLISNKYLRKVLNPPKGRGSDLDFDDALSRGVIITMGTAQGALRELGRYLGYFIILQLQASVFRRPGNENTRKGSMLFIDEFQVYSNPGFADMLTMGRSYRVASHLATQAREQIGMGAGKDGKSFVQLVSTNARNKIIYPGASFADAKYYSDEFGTILKTTESKTYAKKRFLSTLSEERVSTAVKEAEEARFSPSDIIYKEFGMITYCLINKNSIQAPGVSKIEYIPYELNQKLDKMVEEYNEEQFKKDEESSDMYKNSVDRSSFNKKDNMFATSSLENAEIKPMDEYIDPISAISNKEKKSKKDFSYENDKSEVFIDDSYSDDSDINVIANTNEFTGNFTRPPVVTKRKSVIVEDNIIDEDIMPDIPDIDEIGGDLEIDEGFDDLM